MSLVSRAGWAGLGGAETELFCLSGWVGRWEGAGPGVGLHVMPCTLCFRRPLAGAAVLLESSLSGRDVGFCLSGFDFQ